MKSSLKRPPKTPARIITLFAVTALLDTACVSSASIERAKTLRNEANKAIVTAQTDHAANTPPVVSSKAGAYLAGAKVVIAEPVLPILNKEFAYHSTNPVGLSDIASWVTQTTGLSVDISEMLQVSQSSPNQGINQPGIGAAGQPSAASANQPVRENQWRMNMNYYGKLSGLLDVAANKSGGWWHVDDGKIVFFRTLTQTFFLVAPSQEFIGAETISTNSGGNNGSGDTKAGMTASSGTDGKSIYTFKLWHDLEETAKKVAGNAQIAVNPSTGSITVTGSPAQVRQVGQWVKQQNDKLSQQVAISVHMYTVKMKHEDHYSWNPSVIFKATKDTAATLTGIAGPAIASGTAAGALKLSAVGAGKLTGSALALNALSTLGDVTETVNKTVVSLIAHPVPVQLVNSKGYICNVASSQTANVGSSASISQCNLTTGFTALFVPNIVNGKVVLVMKITNSTDNGFSTTPPQNGSYVQTANTDSYKFEQVVSLTPGDALLLTSLQKDKGSEQLSGIGKNYNVAIGGGIGGASDKTMIAIVVSANIL